MLYMAPRTMPHALLDTTVPTALATHVSAQLVLTSLTQEHTSVLIALSVCTAPWPVSQLCLVLARPDSTASVAPFTSSHTITQWVLSALRVNTARTVSNTLALTGSTHPWKASQSATRAHPVSTVTTLIIQFLKQNQLVPPLLLSAQRATSASKKPALPIFAPTEPTLNRTSLVLSHQTNALLAPQDTIVTRVSTKELRSAIPDTIVIRAPMKKIKKA